MRKVKSGMKSLFKNPMTGNIQVDEFVFGGKETGKQGRSYDSKKVKVVCMVELTKTGKVKIANLQRYLDEYFYRLNRSLLKKQYVTTSSND